VIAAIDEGAANFHTLYPDSMKPLQKIETIAFQIYHAGDVVPSKQASDRLAELERFGFWQSAGLHRQDPVFQFRGSGRLRRAHRACAAAARSAPVRRRRIIVAICGDIMTMPGLPRQPSAESIMVDRHGHIVGLS